jgi:hypothetical protein
MHFKKTPPFTIPSQSLKKPPVLPHPSFVFRR